MILTVNLVDLSIQFRVLQTPMAKLWLERMSQRHQWSLDDSGRFYGFNTQQQDEQVALAKIQECVQGINDWQRAGYGGPCPPIGNHRYFHKLYALDILLPNLRHPTKVILEKAMEGHIIDHAELIGLYQRNS